MTKHQGACIILFLYETTLLQVKCLGVPLSCRFFMQGFPPHKNAACGYPGSVPILQRRGSANDSIFKLVQDVSKKTIKNLSKSRCTNFQPQSWASNCGVWEHRRLE
jgi:hypothetical protein